VQQLDAFRERTLKGLSTADQANAARVLVEISFL
jgi:hypothetical protein